MKFTPQDIEFLDKLNNTGAVEGNIYITAQHGYMRNLDRDKVVALEAIHKRVFAQPKFNICYHCSSDIMKMVLQLYRELEKEKALTATIETMVEETINEHPIPEGVPLQAIEYEPKKLSKSKK